MSTYEHGQCPIWPNQENYAGIHREASKNIVHVKYSFRAGCDYYSIGFTEEKKIKDGFLSNEDERIRLTTLLINEHLNDVKCPHVTSDMLDKAKNANGLNRNKRKNRLLKFLSTQTKNLSDPIELRQEYAWHITLKAMAWTESLELMDVPYFAKELFEEGFLDDGRQYRYTITWKGRNFIDEIDKDHSKFL